MSTGQRSRCFARDGREDEVRHLETAFAMRSVTTAHGFAAVPALEIAHRSMGILE